jgi:hypothetical protein
MLRLFLASLCLAAVAYAAPASRPLPDVAIPTLNRKVITFKQYRGKVMVIALISTDCRPCLRTVQILDQMQKDLGPKGFQAVAAAFELDAKFHLGNLVNRYRPSYPVGYLDRDGAFKLAGLAAGAKPFVPVLMVVDSKGMVRFQVTGENPMVKKNEDKTLRLVVNNYLKELTPAAAPASKKTESAPDTPPSPAPGKDAAPSPAEPAPASP